MEHSHISFVFVSRSSKSVICDLWTAQIWNAFFRVGAVTAIVMAVAAMAGVTAATVVVAKEMVNAK